MPYEIDWFEWQSKQLKQGSLFLDENDEIIIDVTLNLNVNIWENSLIPKQFFIDKFNNIKSYFDWCEAIFEINDDNTCLGIDDKRRNSIRKYNPDNFIFLDCDLIFKPETLAFMLNGAKYIKEDYYILSPQTPKLWDHTWDVLSNESYLNENYGFEKLIDPYSILNNHYGEVSLIPINTFKFGGGWFNLLSTKLLKLTDIPDSFGPYGVDDTFIMFCCGILKQHNYNVQQYVIKNIVVAENYKYRFNSYSNYLKMIDKKDEYRKQAEENFGNELNKFFNQIKNN